MRDIAALRIHVQHAMKAAVEFIAVAELLEGDVAHARHDSHAERYVKGVGEFNPHFRKRRTWRSHEVRNHVHRTSAHCARAIAAKLLIHFLRRHPVIRWAGFLLVHSAYKCGLFDTGDIVGIRAMIIAAWQLLLVELDQNPLFDRFSRQRPSFRLRAIAPEDVFRLAKFHHLRDPGQHGLIGRIALSRRFLCHR